MKVLAVEKQKALNWCWAAVAVSVARYFDHATTWTQCTLAAAVLNRRSYDSDQEYCCQDPVTDECNQPHNLEGALRDVNVTVTVQGSLTFQDVQERIRRRRPLPVMIDWGGDAHFVVLTDCKVTRGRIKKVFVGDPYFISSWVNYDYFLTNYHPASSHPGHPSGNGRWRYTYLI